MNIRHTTPAQAATAEGVVVAIDVIRAFTTAAFAFAAGAQAIVPVATTGEALALQARLPGALLMGEEGGLRPPGFDYGNSPAALVGQDLRGAWVVQRTGMGTPALVQSVRASGHLAAAFVCAAATVRYLHHQNPPLVTFLPTGLAPEGAEDAACANYLAALLGGQPPDPTPFLQQARQSYAGRMFTDQLRPGFDPADLACCLALDHFDFAMVAAYERGLLVLRAASQLQIVDCRL